MATDIMGFVQFSDGSFASLLKEGATAETVTSVPTGGNGLNQVSGVEIGQAYQGKVAVAANLIVQTDSATTGCFCYGYFLGPDGKIITPVQGGGHRTTGLPRLARSVRMQTGVTLQACFDAKADAVALASLAVTCSDGTGDVFFIKAVADTATSMVNKDGSSIGQALTGKVLQSCYATYSSTNGLNDDGGGVGAFYIESAEGSLKFMVPPSNGVGQDPSPWVSGYGVRITQNDVLYVNAGV